jgi:hypothetical protein
MPGLLPADLEQIADELELIRQDRIRRKGFLGHGAKGNASEAGRQGSRQLAPAALVTELGVPVGGVGAWGYNPPVVGHADLLIRTGVDTEALALSRSGWVALGVGVGALGAAAAFGGQQYTDRVQVTAVEPTSGSAIATRRPLIALDAHNATGMRDLQVTLDGADVTATAGRDADGRIVVPTRKLADGVHTVTVSFGTSNLFSRSVSETWDFTVDTKLPPLRVAKPASGVEIASKSVPVTGTSEAGAAVSVSWKGGSAQTVAGDDGTWSLTATVPEGPASLKVTASDAAGNAAVAGRAVIVDTTAPTVKLVKQPKRLTETDAPVLSGTLAGEKPDRARLTAVVNGRKVVPVRGAEGVDESGNPIPSVTFDGNRFTMSVGTVPQGTNTVKVLASDPAGNDGTAVATVLVDSTEDLGEKDLIAGARGADVKALQKDLRSRGFKRTRVTGVFDARTQRAVRNYQRVRGLRQSGIFGPNTRNAFFGRLVVDLSTFRVSLIRDGKVFVTYPIAHGTARYPTPTGKFRIVNKQADPTWTPPPDSDWAKGLGPVPPGPGNPLGTRWMGTSAPYVGLHGTPAPGTIGTRASHGCIRMRIPDAEALYEHVQVGMPIVIRA